MADSDGSDYSEIISNIHDESTMVGSDVYTDMLKASGLSDKEKADLVIVQMGGTIDENGLNGDLMHLVSHTRGSKQECKLQTRSRLIMHIKTIHYIRE